MENAQLWLNRRLPCGGKWPDSARGE